MQTFYSYLSAQKTLNSEHLEFTESLVLQISLNFFLCQSKCNNHLLREVLVTAQTDKYIICQSTKKCINCERIKSMLLMVKVPAINNLMKSSNLKRFYFKWVTVFGEFLKKLTEGSVYESKLETVDCYKNTGHRRMMMQPAKRISSGGFFEAVYSASTMKREINLFISKYRLDRSMQVFSKALEPQNLEFFANYDHFNIKRTINNDYKTDVKNVDFVCGIQVKNRVLDLQRDHELHEKKRRNLLQFMLVEIFFTLILRETECSNNEVADIFESLVDTFSVMGVMMRAMSSLNDSGEHICKDGLFMLPQSSIMKKCVLELGQELGCKVYFKIEEASRLMSSMNSFQLAIIQIHVLLKLAIDTRIIAENFLEVFTKMIRMIQNLCSVISISEAADICYQTVKLLEVNEIVFDSPLNIRVSTEFFRVV